MPDEYRYRNPTIHGLNLSGQLPQLTASGGGINARNPVFSAQGLPQVQASAKKEQARLGANHPSEIAAHQQHIGQQKSLINEGPRRMMGLERRFPRPKNN